MKKLLYTIGAIALLMLSTGCQDKLDEIKPSGSTLSLEQLQKGASVSEDRAQAGLPGMYAMLTTYNVVYAMQGDFGYPSMAARLEHMGDNVVSTTHGYNWFSRELRWSNIQSKNSTPSNWSWIATYKNIKLANDIIAASSDPTSDAVKQALGQAKAQRAWNYMFLAQLFQHTYKGNESKPCVPIVTEETTSEELADNPRATVKEVYDFIVKDLTDAVELLKGYKPVTKNFISEATAYGLRARAYMIMNKWAEAAQDAQKAITVSGAQPFSIEDCSIPNFDDVQAAKNALWGIIITQEDGVTKTGIANWTSMFTSLCFGNGGYTTMVGTYKMINTRLWNRIPATDVRKGWWTGFPVDVPTEEGTVTLWTSPLLMKAYPNDAGWVSQELLPYSVVKFAPNNKSLNDPVNAVDFMLMRVEEMYYNLAESKAMAGDFAGGKKILEDFVKTYRDPQFASKANNAKELQDEIYEQKRVEFWGEGISWFDMKRLRKDFDRIDLTTGDNGGYPELTRFNIKADDPITILQIPESEEQANKAIEGNNNPLGTDPKDQM